jgi:hypothetical protein
MPLAALTTTRRSAATMLAAALALLALPAHAAIPPVAALEGLIANAAGGPAPDGVYNVTFALYKDEVGGNPLFVEGPVAVGVKGGLFSWLLGSKAKLDQAALAASAGGFVAVKFDNDAELPRKPLAATLYALRAAVAAELDCSGCVKPGHLDPGVLNEALKGYAKTADLHKVATSGKFSDLAGAPDTDAYAKKAELAKVAVTGAFSDLQGGPDLSGYAKKADLHKVATSGSYADLANLPALADVAKSGSYADLKNLPALAKLGTACGTGLVLKGLKADGSYECTPSLDTSKLSIDMVSGGLMFFGKTFNGSKDVLIPDNTSNQSAGTDKLNVPDIGVATKLTVTVELAVHKGAGYGGSPSVADKRVLLIGPDSSVYTLFCGSAAAAFKVDGKSICEGVNDDKDYPFLKVYPSPTAPIAGDLSSWVGKNPAGPWELKVYDYGFNGNSQDGKIASWSINIHGYGNKLLNIKASAVVEGDLDVGGKINGVGYTNYGAVYTKWGSKECPSGSLKLYDGAAYSSHYNHTHGTTGICIKAGDPGPSNGYEGDILYPMHTSGPNGNPSGVPENRSIYCAVCKYNGGFCFDQWGGDSCPTGFDAVVKGKSMGAHYTHHGPVGHYCIDLNGFDQSAGGTGNGHLYVTRIQSTGNYDGNKWPAGREVKCAVCCAK